VAPIHQLKIWPQFFDDVESGRKPFELRRDDRGYQAGDTLQLREWNPATELYSGREMYKRITHVTRIGRKEMMDLSQQPGCESMEPMQGLVSGFCILGVAPAYLGLGHLSERYEFQRADLRKMRAQTMVYAVLEVLRRYTEPAREVQGRITADLMDMFRDKGVEVLTDFDRERYGLPKRSADGWSLEEIQAVEAKRLELMMRPAPTIVPIPDR